MSLIFVCFWFMDNRPADPSSSSSLKRPRKQPTHLEEFVVGDNDEEFHELFEELHREGQVQPQDQDRDKDLDDPFEELSPPPARPLADEEIEEEEQADIEIVEQPAKRSNKKTDEEKRAEAVTVLEGLGFNFEQTLDEADDVLSEHYDVEPRVGQARHLPRGLNSALDYFRLFFTDVMSRHLVECANEYLRSHPNSKFDETLRTVSKDDVDNFLALYFALCLVNYSRIRDAWSEDSSGLFGNKFFSETMSRNRFQTLYRCLGSDIGVLLEEFNNRSHHYWKLGTNLCFDDQLERYLGYGSIKYIPTKACKMGIACWQIVDSSLYCYHVVWEEDVAQSLPRGVLLGDQLARLLSSQLEDKHEVYIDAGPLGSWETAMELRRRGHHFIISCATNRPSWIFGSFLHKEQIGVRDVAAISNGQVMAICYQSPKSKKGVSSDESNRKGKKVNLLTSIPGLWKGSETTHVDPTHRNVVERVRKPAAIVRYNEHHGYCDQMKSAIRVFDHEHRCSRRERHKFFSLLRLILNNAYVLLQSQLNRVGFDRHDFLVELVRQLRHITPPPPRTPPTPFHPLVSLGRNDRGYCVVCHARTTFSCQRCSPRVYLCGSLSTDCTYQHHKWG